MLQRVDFLMEDTRGKYASFIRVYVNYKRIYDLRHIDIDKGYNDNITYKHGPFYWLYTLYADENDIEIKDSTIKIRKNAEGGD